MIVNVFFFFFLSTKYLLFCGKAADQGHRGLSRTKDYKLYLSLWTKRRSWASASRPGFPLSRYLWKAALLNYDEKSDTTIFRSKSEIVGTAQDQCNSMGRGRAGGTWASRIRYTFNLVSGNAFHSALRFRFDKASKLFIFLLQLRKITGN